MKKKAIFLAFTLLAIPILTALPAFAGKGQVKLDFMLFLKGGGTGVDEVRVTDGITHYYGFHWDTTDNTIANLNLEIGGVSVPVEDYTFLGDLAITKTGHTAIHAIDTIFFEDGSTIVLKVQDHADPDEPTAGTINGYGTGALEGIKITGKTEAQEGGIFVRSGTIMGWPTP